MQRVLLLFYVGFENEMDIGVGEMLACGALAGVCGQTMAYPFDVARRRLQVWPVSIDSVNNLVVIEQENLKTKWNGFLVVLQNFVQDNIDM